MSQTHLDYIVCKIVAKIFQKVAQSGHAVWLSSIFWPTFGRRVQSGFCDQLSGVKNCVKNCFSETLKGQQKAAGRSVVKSCEKLLCSTRCNPDNGHHWGMDHCTAGVQFDKTGLDQQNKICGYLYVGKQLNLNQS